MNTNKKRILAVDDEPSVTNGLKRNLEDTGNYEVCPVNNPQQALATARQFRPHMIFLDEVMPGIMGDELVNLFRTDPGLKDVPVVFLTAVVKKEEQGPIGPDFFLAKPASTQQVLDCIRAHIGD
jgi:CheY-like chemotaxis protein